MTRTSNNIWNLFCTLLYEWFYAAFLHLYFIHTMLVVYQENDHTTTDQGMSNMRVEFFFSRS